ncbi:hypothetical protein MWN34_10695 [Ancylobacter sp. 6x-1]|uniref:Conjugal transfer protein TrbL n=1 Tax=Ancylobacter crimeensis TaxID=2579147 RepID=A0ABT0DBP2_9HYPH|nr:hypothetical protein [Ancylobacter crimeensis]MCK0197380.1 hypothetical protein [Ancylobacter crimeensis]
MENVFDSIGNALKSAGEGSHGLARGLEYVTGNATAAALFALFLWFALSLIRGAAGARHFTLYGNSIRLLGGAGLVGLALLAVYEAIIEPPPIAATPEDRALVYKGLTGKDFVEPSAVLTTSENLIKWVSFFKWYALVFVIMVVVGSIVVKSGQLFARMAKARDSHRSPE